MQFFHEAIVDNLPKEVSEHTAEIIHCATLLTHYSTTSTVSSSGNSLPVSMSLDNFFDVVVMDRSGFVGGPEDQIHFGAQVLFLSGFFYDQLKRRHNLNWYESLGASYYSRAGDFFQKRGRPKDIGHSRFSYRMSNYYPFWVCTLHRVSVSLRRNQFDPRLIRL